MTRSICHIRHQNSWRTLCGLESAEESISFDHGYEGFINPNSPVGESVSYLHICPECKAPMQHRIDAALSRTQNSNV